MSEPPAHNPGVLTRSSLAGLLGELDRDLGTVAALRAVDTVREPLGELRRDLDDQLDRARSAAVICLVGATGAGKSTLLNALVGREVAREGVDRPTTSAPVIYRPSDADVSSLIDGLPGEPPRIVSYEDEGQASGDAFWRGQILIDAPDTNSVATVHRDVVRHLSSRADVLVVVAHRQSVAELSSAKFIDLFAERRGMVFVLGRSDELDERSVGELLGQLRELRDDRWRSPDAPVVAISARAARETAGGGNLSELQRALTELITAEKLGSVRRRNAVGTVAQLARTIRQSQGSASSQGSTGDLEALEAALENGANEWCGGIVAATSERLDVRRADLGRMLWNDAAKLWDGPGGYALKVGGLSALGMGAGAAVARRNPVLAAGLAVGSVAADRMRGAVRERQFESTSGLLPGGAELEAIQRDAFLEARLSADDAFLAEEGLAPGPEELDAHAVRAVDDAWDRLLRVDLPREAARGVPRALRLFIDLPVYGLGAWVLVRVAMGFVKDSYVGVDFLVSAAIIALSWLFFARMLVRARLSSRSAALLAAVRGDIEQRVGSAARAAVEHRQGRLSKSKEALARLESLDALWRERLHGERPAGT